MRGTIGVGSMISAGLGMIAGTAMHIDRYMGIIDVQVKEKVNGTINAKMTSNLKQGAGTTYQSTQTKRTSYNKFKIKTQYEDCKNYKISDISLSINLERKQFEPKDNCIYVPKIGDSQVVLLITDTKIKYQNYFQIELNPKFAIADYLKLFYKSELGRLILNSLNTGTFTPHINKSDIAESLVALLISIIEQKVLIHTNNKLEELQLELSPNPKNTDVILEKFDSMQGSLKSLSQKDEILSLIRKGEGKCNTLKVDLDKVPVQHTI